MEGRRFITVVAMWLRPEAVKWICQGVMIGLLLDQLVHGEHEKSMLRKLIEVIAGG